MRSKDTYAFYHCLQSDTQAFPRTWISCVETKSFASVPIVPPRVYVWSPRQCLALQENPWGIGRWFFLVFLHDPIVFLQLPKLFRCWVTLKISIKTFLSEFHFRSKLVSVERWRRIIEAQRHSGIIEAQRHGASRWALSHVRSWHMYINLEQCDCGYLNMLCECHEHKI